jgi:mono/diheme cytochrome c family protein
MNIRKFVLITLAALAAVFLLLQLVPYGRAHDNPPVVAEPNWDSPQTRQLAQQACFDCHSNETEWPWYSNIAPVSWLVQRHVVEGREHLNFSDWNQSHDEHGHAGHEAEEMSEVVLEGEMPLRSFLLTHPEARLTDAERAVLADGLAATAALSPTTGAANDHAAGEEHEEGD